MVKAFEILRPFFNIRPSIPVFPYFFQMKLTGKIGWVSLNNESKKMFEFDSNVFRKFRDRFLKVKATSIITDRLLLMYDENGEPRFPFYWQLDLTRFKSFEERLMSSEERVEKAILEQLPT